MGSFLGGIAKTAVGIAPYLDRAVRTSEQEGNKSALMKAQTAAITSKADIKGTIFDRDGTPWNQHTDGSLSRATIRDETPQAPPAPASPSFTGPTDKDWTSSLRRAGPQDTAPQQSMPPVGVTPNGPPQQGSPAQATQPPPGVRTLPKFGKPVGPVKLDPNDPTVAANKATAVATARKPFLSDAAQQSITTDSTKAANRSSIANSPAAITGDSLRKVNTAQAGVAAHAANRTFDVANPLPTKTSAASGKIDPNSPAGITADSVKAANRALSRPGGMTGGMGSGGIGGLARTSAAITEMDQAHQMMVPYETAVKSGTAKYDGLDYFMGLRGKMYDAHGVVDQATHAAAFSHLNQTNPPLANYLRAAEMWALADGGVSGRTSDFRTKLDGFVSAIGPHAGGTQIDNVQRTRTTRLDELKKFQPAMESAAQRFVTPEGRGRGAAAATPGTPARGNDPGGNVDLGAVDPFAKLIPKKP